MAHIEREIEPKPSPEIGVVALKPSNDDLERASATKPSPDDPEQDAVTQTWWQRSQFEIKLIMALALPVFVETLDYTVVASAQGQIASAFGRLDLETWVGTSYVLTSTAFLPLCSNIADILGRHATLQFGFVMFFLGSVISTAAQNMATVLAGRGIAGIGAAFLLALVRVIMTDNRSLITNMLRVAVLSLLFTIGYSTGPIIGGALSSVNFRWIFAINLPIALLGSILAFVTVRNDLVGPIPDPRDNLPGWPTHTPTSRLSALAFQLSRIDWVGAILFTSGAIIFLIGLSWGSTESWDEAKVIACMTIGGVLVVACIVWQFYLGQYDVRFGPDGKTPVLQTRADGTTEELKIPPRAIAHTSRMIPLWIFKNYQIPVVFFGAFTSGMVMFSGLYFLAVYWSIVAGFKNTKTGTQLVYLTPGIGGGVWVAAAMITWWRQPRFPVMIGQVVQAVGVGLLAKAISENSHGKVNGFLAMCGAGVGFSMGTLEVQSRFLLPKEQNSLLTTMHLFFRTAGGTIGLAQLSAVLQSKLRSYIQGLVKSGSLSVQD
ncbi:MFS general substrate transporter, partial [Clavulina sp. PMI_390]